MSKGSDHAITHTHRHCHRVWFRRLSDPHTHEHNHTSFRESWDYEAGPPPIHRNHFHIAENTPTRSR